LRHEIPCLVWLFFVYSVSYKECKKIVSVGYLLYMNLRKGKNTFIM
jgi:hypothetical protein